METQCVTAEQIAQAFMDLMQADQQGFLVVLAVAVFITAAPSLFHRLFDYLEARRANG